MNKLNAVTIFLLSFSISCALGIGWNVLIDLPWHGMWYFNQSAYSWTSVLLQPVPCLLVGSVAVWHANKGVRV